DGGQSGVGVEDGDHRGHGGAADRNDQEDAEGERQYGDDGKQQRAARRGRLADDDRGQEEGDEQQQEIDDVLQRIRDRPLRDPFHFLQLARGHEAAGEGEIAENDLGYQRADAERREAIGSFEQPEVVLDGPDQAGGKAAEGVRQRGPLRHGGERDLRQRNPDGEAGGNRQDDEPMVNDAGLKPGDADRDRGRGHAGVDALPRGGRRVHPVERENEQRGRRDVGELGDAEGHARSPARGFLSVLNIFSIRSVMRKPLTM